MSKEVKKQSSDGRVKHVLVHDSQTGELKRVSANDQDALRKAVPPTELLEQNSKPRKRDIRRVKPNH